MADRVADHNTAQGVAHRGRRFQCVVRHLCSSQPTRHIAHGCLPNAIKEPICTTNTSSKTNAAANCSERLLKSTSLCLGVIQVVWLVGLKIGGVKVEVGTELGCTPQAVSAHTTHATQSTCEKPWTTLPTVIISHHLQVFNQLSCSSESSNKSLVPPKLF